MLFVEDELPDDEPLLQAANPETDNKQIRIFFMVIPLNKISYAFYIDYYTSFSHIHKLINVNCEFKITIFHYTYQCIEK